MRSSKAVGNQSMLRFMREIEALLKKQALLTGVKLYNLANAGNHLHLIIKVPSRRLYRRFVRASSALIARLVLGIKKNQARLFGASFWDERPFTRIVSWGRDYNGLNNYLQINRQETVGFDRAEARQMLAKIKQLQAAQVLQPLGFL